jgi:LssY C-terminus
MTRWLIRMVRRALVVALGIFSVWLIVFVVFDFADNRLPWLVALALTYAVAAYVVLPRTVRMSLKILHRNKVPRYTLTADGLPGDPINLVLVGTLAQLSSAFAKAGWDKADRLSLRSAWHMARAFLFNRPYPTAPFSTLYLFGRGQDIGFQKCIDNSPRRRHHIRFWALSIERAQATLGTTAFWRNTDRPPEADRVLWIGAGTKDTGFSLTQLTFQITHATDADTNTERDFIVAELKTCGVVAEVNSVRAREFLKVGKVNHYVTDGAVTVASLA